MNHHLIARLGLSLLCATQGLATVVLDLNRTHATNPEWPRHARFHVVWQTWTVTLESIVELGLLWSGLLEEGAGFYLALLLASFSPIAFLATFSARKRFGGTLSDPNGIQPLRLSIRQRIVKVDMNLAAVIAALVTMILLVSMYQA